jgi:hypothetical protein
MILTSDFTRIAGSDIDAPIWGNVKKNITHAMSLGRNEVSFHLNPFWGTPATAAKTAREAKARNRNKIPPGIPRILPGRPQGFSEYRQGDGRSNCV